MSAGYYSTREGGKNRNGERNGGKRVERISRFSGVRIRQQSPGIPEVSGYGSDGKGKEGRIESGDRGRLANSGAKKTEGWGPDRHAVQRQHGEQGGHEDACERGGGCRRYNG